MTLELDNPPAKSKGQTLKEMATQRSDIFWVDPLQLNVKPGWNSRVADDPANQDHIANLAQSIAQIGVQEPLTVFREADKIWISDGHCRHAAALYCIEKLGVEIRAVPVKTEGRGTTEADHVLRQLLDGKPKTVFEQGILFKRLSAYGWSVEDIAKRAGKSVQSVNMALDLQGAPEGVKKLVATGRVSPTLAAHTVQREGGEGAQASLVEAVEHASKRGKAKATAKDMSSTPPSQRVSAKQKLERLAEIIKSADWDEENHKNATALIIPDSVRSEFLNLLDI